MERTTAIIGFGEAGRAFAADHATNLHIVAYDPKPDADACRAANVIAADSAAEALAGARAVLSLVTADQALVAACDSAPHLAKGTHWFDMNSVAPDTKRAAAQAITAAGGCYTDVAVMAPVHPARRDVPLLVSGPHAEAAIEWLRAIGFTRMRHVQGGIGAASAIKMIRSVMVKGMEALTAECVLAADAAGVLDEVLASLDASDTAKPWAERADYNLDRMLIHGERRAAEMEEAEKTLAALGIGSAMTAGTIRRQRELGSLGLSAPEGLNAKLAALRSRNKDIAA
ncbi:MAG: NAD(P)-dependent oxidoreductase [Sphingomonadales bacterium]|nr:MAG: NAD(P)-dependent oxidoreductase [Sphingomonadales bacterium]